MIRPWFLIGLSLLTAGCAGTLESLEAKLDVSDVAPDAGNYAKVPPDQIIVYVSERTAPRHYTVVAKLTSRLSFPCKTQEALFGLFREKASELGADAVVVTDIEQGDGSIEVLPGHQPLNDLGYSHASSNETFYEVTPVPLPPDRKPTFMGQALAVRVSP